MRKDKPESKTLAKVIQEAIDAKLYDTHVSLPARIESYDSTKQKASIELLLKKKYIINGETNLPLITDVPVQWPSGNNGKSYIHIPLIRGDTGIAIFSERSLDLWLAGNGTIVSPQDPRKHHIADAMFIPGIRPFKEAINDVSSSNMVIQHDKFRIEIDSSGKISLSGVTEELLTLFDELILSLQNAVILTGIGPQPFTAPTQALLQNIKSRLGEIKR